VEGLVPVAVAKVVERLVEAVKRVKGFEAGRVGGGGDNMLGFGRGEIGARGTAMGRPTEPDWGRFCCLEEAYIVLVDRLDADFVALLRSSATLDMSFVTCYGEASTGRSQDLNLKGAN
jgi:hypothetical protein